MVEILNQITLFIRQFIPDYPNLCISNFTRSFEAYFDELGMKGVYRYHVSERPRFWLEMQLRYSRISSEQVYQVHADASGQNGETYYG